ncbi:MAG: hypothetical protein ACYTGN_17850 [Planctomycetota bacterium]
MRFLLFIALACACGKAPEPAAEGDKSPRPEVAPDRDAWWIEATAWPSGAERILAPRELRALLAAGVRFGFDHDTEWWTERRQFVYKRILDLDPDDPEANAGQGYKTLQAYPGFEELWRRMIEARVSHPVIDELIERWDHKVGANQPAFMDEDRYAIWTAKLGQAKEHLDKLASDPAYEGLQVALARVRGSSLNDFPFVHYAVGPFLIFYSARDLQRIEGEDVAAENERIAGRRAEYLKKLARLGKLHAALLEDIQSLYPAVWREYKPKPRQVHYQWIFSDRSWYAEYLERVNKEDPEDAYRTGYLDKSTGWALMYEPPEPAKDAKKKDDEPAADKPEEILSETAVYLAAGQLLHSWGRDRKALENRLDRSRAYWLKTGWPAHLAALRAKRPSVGRLLEVGQAADMVFPALGRIVERESRLELQRYREQTHEFGEDEDDERAQLWIRVSYYDFSWLLVRYLSAPERSEAFQRYMLSQIRGEKPGLDWFEECFSVEGEAGWRKLQRAVYRTIGKK